MFIDGRSLMKKIVNIFKALSDDTRLRVIKLLEDRELCVCELMQVLDMSQPRISRHLSVLKNAGLVNDRREGKWIHYSLRNGVENEAINAVLQTISRLAGDPPLFQNDRRNLKKARRLGEADTGTSKGGKK